AEAVEIVAVCPPELVRFLMLRTHPKRHLEFDPAGMTLARLMDECDRAADAYRGDEESDLGKTWRLSQVSPTPDAPGFRIRFTTVASWLQIPSIKPDGEAEKEKGARLTEAALRDQHRRVDRRRASAERWAPGQRNVEGR